MKHCMYYAKVVRVRCQYIIDGAPDDKYTVSFGSLNAYHDWLHARSNENKTVLQLCMHYEYPEEAFE